MAIFCVTGNSKKSVEITSDIFLSNGIPKGQDAHRSVDISMAQWHAKALASIPKSQSIHETVERVSASSRTLAIDILAAAQSTPVWFWAEPKSVRFLEFWKSLDTNIKFVLVSADISSHLMSLLETGKLSSENISEVMTEWFELTQKILSFHLSNAASTVLVPVNNRVDFAHQALGDLKEKWNLNIQDGTNNDAKPSDDTDIKLFVVSQILIDYPEVCELDIKLNSAFRHTQPSTRPSKHKKLKNAIDNLYYLASKKDNFIDTGYDQIIAIKKGEDKSRQLSALETDRIALQERFSALAQEYGESREAFHKKYDWLLSENEVLSSHLHHCQETLEKSITKNKELELQVQANGLALSNYAQAHPQYCYYESFDIAVEKLEAGNIYQLVFKNFYLMDSLIPLVRFTITESDDKLKLRFTRGSATWLQWTGGQPLNQDLICDPVFGSPYNATNAQLTALSTSSWDRLIALVDHLVRITHSKLSPDASINCLHDRLAELSSKLNNWPAVSRYDHCELLGSIETGLYQRLEINIENMAAGIERWPCVRYNVATVESSEQTFGQHPRLEFPESAISALNTWHPEIMDPRGLRCELRFAQPNAIDMPAWNAMSGQDQVLVVALISSFNQQAKDIQVHQPSLKIDAAKWTTLMISMKTILSNNITKNPSSPTSTVTLPKALHKK